jgi:hypothetical protein
MFWFLLKEQWYYCNTCKFSFPASEASAHKGHSYYPIAS